MTPDDRLREHFQRTADPGPRSDCPATDRLWAAVTGELPEAEVGAIVDHTAACGECAQAWRLALEMERDAQPRPVRLPLGRVSLIAGVGLAAAAAVFLIVRHPPVDDHESFRQGGSPRIASLSPGVQPREAIDLRWTAVPGAERYTVTVVTPDLAQVNHSPGLTTPELRLPPGALPAGRFLWSVRVYLSDGRIIDSDAFALETR
jgi:hypothetical protein